MDYIIADPVVLPMDQQAFYSEQIVHLPDSYQVNDPGAIGAAPSREEAGAGGRLCLLLLQQPLENHGAAFRGLDAAFAGGAGSVLWLLQ